MPLTALEEFQIMTIMCRHRFVKANLELEQRASRQDFQYGIFQQQFGV